MREVIEIIQNALSTSAALNDNLAEKYRLASTDLPINGLNMAHQDAVLTVEVLGFYAHVWSNQPTVQVANPELLRHENGERVRNATRNAFVSALSSFEFCAKQAIVRFPSKLPPINGRLYLRKIIEQAFRADLVSASDAAAWEGIIELRNAVVHNNGIADISRSYDVPGTQGISFIAGEMGRGDLAFFAEMFLWTVHAFSRWCDGYLNSVSPSAA